MRVISFYTVDTPYEREARRLAQSLARLSIPYVIEGLPSRGSWVENCALKARFVRDMYDRDGGDFWWFDADSELVSHPEPMPPDEVDFAGPIRKGWNLASGACYFGTRPQTRELIECWTDYCERYPFVFDQLLLMFALHNLRTTRQMNIVNLSGRYLKKFKKGTIVNSLKKVGELLGLRDRPIVRQYQASTRLKEKVARPSENHSDSIEVDAADCPQPIRDLLAGNRHEQIDIEQVILSIVAEKHGPAGLEIARARLRS